MTHNQELIYPQSHIKYANRGLKDEISSIFPDFEPQWNLDKNLGVKLQQKTGTQMREIENLWGHSATKGNLGGKNAIFMKIPSKLHTERLSTTRKSAATLFILRISAFRLNFQVNSSSKHQSFNLKNKPIET